MAEEVIQIDGGYLEGGGQILRMSLALSAIMKVPLCVDNIRKGRSKPGLGHQHLEGLKLVAEMCQGNLRGGEIGSTKINFIPGDRIPGGNYTVNCKTAGSVSLIAQAAYPCGLYAEQKSRLQLEGGTNAAFAPPSDYTHQVFKHVSSRFGVDFDIATKVRGFYPKGGGKVTFDVSPAKSGLKAVELLEPGTVNNVHGVSLVAGTLPIRMSHQMADAAVDILKRRLHPSTDININRIKEQSHTANGNGSTIILWAETTTGCIFGGSAIGNRNKTTQEVGEAAAEDLLKSIESGGCVDRYSQDQIIILMSLACGKSRVRTGPLEDHTKTAIYVAEKMTKAKFKTIEDPSSETTIIECDGVGVKP